MQTVAEFVRGEDAHLFRSFLNSEGIEAHVFDEYSPQLFRHYSMVPGGVRVVVADEDREQAEGFFADYTARLSQDTVLSEEVRARPFAILISLLAGFPLVLLGKKFAGRNDRNP